jgi:hypothetical protein
MFEGVDQSDVRRKGVKEHIVTYISKLDVCPYLVSLQAQPHSHRPIHTGPFTQAHPHRPIHTATLTQAHPHRPIHTGPFLDPYIYAVHDRKFGESPAGNTVYAPPYVRVGRNHIYIRYRCGMFGRMSPNIRSYTVYIYGSGQPYVCVWFWPTQHK